ncbi:MAG: decaprenyl-phosphate phosphoribosyltransferase [Pyrinomonadaceae bacterium]|nr:decaprenyl-phosphate phosphoribosyltransferase [Pyrinomonadaceae bacterium]
MSERLIVQTAARKAPAVVESRGLIRLIWAEMRPHQWVKNLFIFAPLLFGRKLADPSAVANSALAFAVFCCIASGLYIINDIIDAEDDRSHPEKRLRPISSGALPIPVAILASISLTAAGFWIAASIRWSVFLVAAAYFLLTLTYCLVLKKIMILDGMTISAGFVLRIIGGAFAIGVLPTHWLIACAFLLALFLAFTKRRQEILMLDKTAGEHRKTLEEYSVGYLDQVNTILISAVLVCYALYTVAPETVSRFETTSLIYGTVFVIYGMLRYMVLIKSPDYGGNPSRMLLKDKPLLLTVAGWAIYNAFVIYHLDITDLFELFH